MTRNMKTVEKQQKLLDKINIVKKKQVNNYGNDDYNEKNVSSNKLKRRVIERKR